MAASESASAPEARLDEAPVAEFLHLAGPHGPRGRHLCVFARKPRPAIGDGPPAASRESLRQTDRERSAGSVFYPT